MIRRILEKRLRGAAKSILLLGPRQVGKSTLCQSLQPQFVINLADEETYRNHLKDPALIKRQLQAIGSTSLVLIDEIQRIPTLLNTLQVFMDHHPQVKFLLTGSSARKLKRGKANLLPGRLFVEHLSPLVYWEIKNNFNLERCLQTGNLPEIYFQDYGPELLSSYIDTYLREEIQAEAATKNLGYYSRFLDLSAELSGQHLNYSKIASDAEIEKETVRRYFQILQDTLLIERLPSFTEIKSKRRVRQKDRFLFFDVGVRNAILKKHLAPLTQSEKGHLFEQWVILQCLYFNQLYKKNWRLSSFRTDTGLEVDLIIETSNALIPIEIKYSRTLQTKSFKGLWLFSKLAKQPQKPIIIFCGSEPQKTDTGALALPIEIFLDQFLPSLS